MPHFGLMDTAESFRTPGGALLRARLHIRSGKRRLKQGKISEGVVTLYDALLFAMHWYLISAHNPENPDLKTADAINDDRAVFAMLQRAGVLRGPLEYDEFNGLVETALHKAMPDFDYTEILKKFESAMTDLGVMPFDESALPPEDPSTF